jgi:hypothetical protein
VGICALLVLAVPFAPPNLLNRFTTPESAMDGMTHMDVVYVYVLRFLYALSLLVALALYYLTRPKHRWLAVVPCLAGLPLFGATHLALSRSWENAVFLKNFRISEAALDAFADRIEAGETPVLPSVVGKFRIIGYEQLHPGVALYTKVEPPPQDSSAPLPMPSTSDGYARWLECWGFVRRAGVQEDSGRADLVGFTGDAVDVNGVQRLRNDWFVVFSSYGWIKRGWS